VGAKVHVAVEALRAPTPKAGAGAPREATVCTTTELAFRVPTKLEQAAVSSVLNTSVPDAAVVRHLCGHRRVLKDAPLASPNSSKPEVTQEELEGPAGHALSVAL
jgi:hypothetical protein